jgi:hypothetical protein
MEHGLVVTLNNLKIKIETVLEAQRVGETALEMSFLLIFGHDCRLELLFLYIIHFLYYLSHNKTIF